MSDNSPSQVTLLPKQLSRLAELFGTEGGAIRISQDGSIITAENGRYRAQYNAQGEAIAERLFLTQETSE